MREDLNVFNTAAQTIVEEGFIEQKTDLFLIEQSQPLLQMTQLFH